jgi:hypothetical protein
MSSVPKWLGVLSLCAGCLLAVITVVDAWSTREFIRSAQRADGVVTELNAGAAHPQVQFQLPSGEKVEFPASGDISYSKAQRAPVLYLPEDPFRSARLDDFGDLWMPMIIRTGMALVFIALGLRGLRSL